MSEIIFRGFTGKIDGRYYHNVDPASQIAIIFHGQKQTDPDEQKVVDTIFDCFVKNGFSVLTINFSDKKNILNEDERENADLFDSTISLNWLYEKNQETKGCWIIGYDKATMTALQLVMRRPEIENYMLISPNMNKNDLSFIVPCISYGCLVKSEQDSLVSDDSLIDLQEKLMTKTESKIETLTIPSEKRNYSDNIDGFKNILDEYIKKRVFDFFNNTKSGFDKKKRRRKKKIEDQNDMKISYVNPIKPLDFDNI